jgi:hypothetical protein
VEEADVLTKFGTSRRDKLQMPTAIASSSTIRVAAAKSVCKLRRVDGNEVEAREDTSACRLFSGS